MAEMRRTMITVELTDGKILGPERVIFADKMRLERSAKANKWDIGRDEFRTQSFLAWAALERTKATTLKYDDFLDKLTDVVFEANAQDEDGEDPTTADTSA